MVELVLSILRVLFILNFEVQVIVGSSNEIWNLLVSLLIIVKNKYVLVVVVKIVGVIVKGNMVN